MTRDPSEAVTLTDWLSRVPMQVMVDVLEETIELTDDELDCLEALADATPRALRALRFVPTL